MVDGVVDVGGHAHVANALESRVERVKHGAAVQADDEVVLLGVSAIGVESGRGAWKRSRDDCRAVICKSELAAVRSKRLARNAADDSAGAARAEVERERVAADDGGAAERGEERAQDDHFERARFEQQRRREAVVPPGGGHGAPAGADLDDVPSNRRQAGRGGGVARRRPARLRAGRERIGDGAGGERGGPLPLVPRRVQVAERRRRRRR